VKNLSKTNPVVTLLAGLLPAAAVSAVSIVFPFSAGFTVAIPIPPRINGFPRGGTPILSIFATQFDEFAKASVAGSRKIKASHALLWEEAA
jgi:hypothetical protein